MFQWCRHQTLQGRFVEPMILVGLPSTFSEQAKFDRQKGFLPIRISFEAKNQSKKKELYEDWPENRVPIGFSEEEDINAEGKYNYEIFQAANLMEVDSTDSDDSSPESAPEEVPDYGDGPLIEF